MCVWLKRNLSRKTLATLGRSSLVELGRWLDDKLTLNSQTKNSIR